MKKFFQYYFPIILWALLIFSVPSLMQSKDLNRTPYHLDKIAHIIEFGILGFLIVRAFYYGAHNRELKRAVLLTLGIAVFFAGGDEFHQIYLSDRIASFYDFFADIIGITGSLILFWYFKSLRRIPE